MRLVAINQSLWLDEATSALVVRDMSFSRILNEFSPGDFHPPFYYLSLKVWASFFGTTEFGLRLFSVAVGLATIFLVYLIGKEIKNRKVGTLASAFLATSGLHVYYSQEARMYALSAFWVTLLVYLFLKIHKRGTTLEWLLFSVALTINSLTDYLPNLIIVVLWLYAVFSKKDARWWKKFILSHTGLLFAWALWLPTFIGQLSSGLGVKTGAPAWWNVLGRTTIKEILLVPTKFIFGRIGFVNKALYAVVAGLVSFIYGLIIIMSLPLKTRILKNNNILLIWFWIIVPILLAAVLGLRISVFSYFRLIFVLPAFYLLLATGLVQIQKKWIKVGLSFVLIVNLATSGVYLLNKRFHREDWRGLVEFIESQSKGKNAITLFVADSQMEAYRYYSKEAKIVYHVDDDSRLYVAGPSGLKDDFEQIWLMRYVRDIFDTEDELRMKVEGSGYEKVGEFDFNGVVVWKYNK